MTEVFDALDVVVVGDIGVAQNHVGNPGYDFDFRRLLAGRSQRFGEVLHDAIARVGPIADYARLEQVLAERDVFLANSREAHARASRLSVWYPRIAHLTPRSRVLAPEDLAQATHIAADLGWPVFVKGDRQTSRHDASLAIARSPDALTALLARYRADSILHWQPVVLREHLSLRRVRDAAPGGLPAAFEFRTFWWRDRLLAAGPYWSTDPGFHWTDREREQGLAVAREAAQALDVPFLVVDIAQDVDRRWWVIECNDGQESGLAGCSPLQLWQSLVEVRRDA